VGFYVVGVLMMVTSRPANAVDASAAAPVNDLVPDSVAPSIQPTEVELDASIETVKPIRSTQLAHTDQVH
jgi:hypothetical protein